MREMGGISVTHLNNGAHFSFINNILEHALADNGGDASADRLAEESTSNIDDDYGA